MTPVTDELGFTLCHHGRRIMCAECAVEYAQELQGPAGGRRGTSIAAESQSGLTRQVPDESPGAIPDHICGICYHAFDQCGHCHSQDITQLVREVQAMRGQRDRLRAALVGLIGVDGRGELEEMETAMRLLPAPAQDRAVSIDAIHALIATLPETSSEAPQSADAVDPQAGSTTS